MRRVADYWSEFEPVCEGSSALGLQQLRTSFYAGFLAAINAGQDMQAEAKNNDDVGATIMERLHTECAAFLAADLARRLSKEKPREP